MATNSQVVVRNKTLTRSVSAANTLASTTEQSSSTTIKDYTLNKAKSLEKKNAGCLKEHMKCKVKQGNNVVIEMSTAAYELSKVCLHELLNNESSIYCAERKDSFELNGANVDTTRNQMVHTARNYTTQHPLCWWMIAEQTLFFCQTFIMNFVPWWGQDARNWTLWIWT